MSELKPCPFCGGEGKLNNYKTAVHCIKCKAHPYYLGSESEAIAAWNTRPELEQKDEAIQSMADDMIELQAELEQKDELLDACKAFAAFAKKDLPKGFNAPEKWLLTLKGLSFDIKQAIERAKGV